MISVIIPIYNYDERLVELTRKCLETLKTHTKGWIELIIVDNASPIRTEWNCDILIRNKKNLGNAKAWNQGAKLARGDYLLFADNDVEFSEGWEKMTERMGIVFPLSKCGNQQEFTEQLAGYFWMVDRKTFERLGYVSEEYGLGYYEDTDYFMRAQKEGISLSCNTNVKVFHHGKATSQKMEIMEDFIIKNKRLYETKFNGEYPTL